MAFEGMDVDAAARMARTLEDQANEVGRVLSKVTTAMPDLMSVWKGQDATNFDAEWSGHRQSLQALQYAVGDLVNSLNRSIADQRAASGN